MLGKIKQLALGAAALAGAVAGGAAIAGAATSHSGTTTTVQVPSQQARPPLNMPAHGTAAHENDEKAVTGSAAAKAQAAAVKAAGGGTAGKVTTDCTGSGYEVTVTKSDGSTVEIHLDSAFNVLRGPGGQDGGSPPWSAN
jgi:nicotinic acid phosphoribosyltransferase